MNVGLAMKVLPPFETAKQLYTRLIDILGFGSNLDGPVWAMASVLK